MGTAYGAILDRRTDRQRILSTIKATDHTRNAYNNSSYVNDDASHNDVMPPTGDTFSQEIGKMETGGDKVTRETIARGPAVTGIPGAEAKRPAAEMGVYIYVYVDTVFGFCCCCCLLLLLCLFFFLNCLVGCFSIIAWTPAVLSVLYACVLYFCICPCSAQLSVFHMQRRSRNALIIITVNSVSLRICVYHAS